MSRSSDKLRDMAMRSEGMSPAQHIASIEARAEALAQAARAFLDTYPVDPDDVYEVRYELEQALDALEESCPRG